MTPARWIVFAVDLHLGRLLPASGPGPLRQAQGYNRERAIARWGHLNHVRSAQESRHYSNWGLQSSRLFYYHREEDTVPA